MTRPQSIVWFERLYLLSFVAGLVSTAQNWGARSAMLASRTWLGPVSTAVGIGIALALWYLVAWRANTIAKWIVVVLAAWGLMLLGILVFGLIVGRGEPMLLAVGAVQNLLYLAAVAMLFRPDARAWFGDDAPTEAAA